MNCTSGPKNQSLARELKIDKKNCLVIRRGKRTVIFLFDFIHLFKNYRNFILDKGQVIFTNGLKFHKTDLIKLMWKAQDNTLSLCKLTDLHFTCQSSNRQNVRLATELLSDSVSQLLLDLFPGDSHMAELSQHIKMMNDIFNLFTSRVEDSDDYSKASFEKYYLKQKKLVEDVKWHFENLENANKHQFHKGFLITINGFLALYEVLSTQYGVKSFKTHTVTSDDLEGLFGIIKQMWGGSNVDPCAYTFMLRLSEYITLKILEDKDYNIFSLKEKLNNEPIEEESEEEIILPTVIKKSKKSKKSKQQKCSEAQEIELKFLAGRLAYLFKQHNLSDENKTIEKLNKTQTDRFLTKSLKKAMILTPNSDWLSDVKKMNQVFSAHHPDEKSLLKAGVKKRFLKILRREFPEIQLEILEQFINLRTRMEQKKINFNTEAKKKKKLTLKAAKKTARFGLL